MTTALPLVLWEGSRKRLSHRHWGLFSLCCPGKFSTRSKNQEMLSHKKWCLCIYGTSLLLLMAFSATNRVHLQSSFVLLERSAGSNWCEQNKKKAASVNMVPCYLGSIEQEFSTSCKSTVVFSAQTDKPVSFWMRAAKQWLTLLCLTDLREVSCTVYFFL